MRRPLVICAALAGVAAIPASGIGASATVLKASMKGSEEVPGANTRAAGQATFRVAANGKSFTYKLTGGGLSGRPTAAHIHLGARGRSGGVLVTLRSGSFSLPARGRVDAGDFSATGDVGTFAEAIRAMKAGRTYVNIHTRKFAAGEIRGQVRRSR